MYADDTLLYCSGKDPFELCRKINEDLEHIRQWLITNKLHLNMKKTEYIVFGSKQRLDRIDNNAFDIQINGNPVRRVRECKHLGVYCVWIIVQNVYNVYNHSHGTISPSPLWSFYLPISLSIYPTFS